MQNTEMIWIGLDQTMQVRRLNNHLPIQEKPSLRQATQTLSQVTHVTGLLINHLMSGASQGLMPLDIILRTLLAHSACPKVHTDHVPRYISLRNRMDSPSDSPLVTSPCTALLGAASHHRVIVMLGPGVRLCSRFLGVASVLGFLLLPPATQICGKRVLRMRQ